MIEYTVSPVRPAAHQFEITLRISKPSAGGQRLWMPAWIPGSYMIRDFARNVIEFSAARQGQPVKFKKLDKQNWLLEPCSGAITVRYRVYAWDLSVRAAHLDTTHAYFNGPSLLLGVGDQEREPCDLVLQRPPGEATGPWRVATSLPPLHVDEEGFGRYRADDYYSLIDFPIEMGPFSSIEFQAGGIPHRMAISGRQRCDLRRLAQDLERICNEHISLFGPPPPMKRYLFLTQVVGEGYGGLEHADSCSLICARDDLPEPGMTNASDEYRRFLALCSHEYFHLWNVKRIKPAAFDAPDLSREVHTSLLWAFEGITSYYDELAVVRSRCIEPSSYLELLAQHVTRVMRGSGRLWQSVAESSFDAWTKFYKQDENAPNAIVSYYTKGGLIAFGLDMTLREASGDRVSLDDLMRELWRRYEETGRGVAEDAIERLASELAGADLSEFFARAVHGTDELPLQEWFFGVGVGYRLRPAVKPDEMGGVIERPDAVEARCALGARFKGAGDLVELTHVLEGGSAQSAGLSAGDRLVALGGVQPRVETLAARVAKLPPGQPLVVHALRRDELMTFVLRPQLAPADTCDLWWLTDAQLSPAQIRRKRDWLKTHAS